MEKTLREAFNNTFTTEKYATYMAQVEAIQPGALDFRNCETPLFIPKAFTQKIIDACEAITDVIVAPDFNELTKNAVPENVLIPNQNEHTQFIAYDFGICHNEQGELEPQLIEMQGFPSLFAFQAQHTALTAAYANVPSNYSAYLNGYKEQSYLQLLNEIILGTHPPENVVLLEIFPTKQKTRIDFYSTQQLVGINYVCLTELMEEDNKLYYLNNGVKTPIHRIYNRIIFDEVQQQTIEIQEKAKLLYKLLKVEWVPHPNWFYKISKYTLPLIQHQYVPTTYYLNQLPHSITNLDNYVLKPLFSFAGQGVIIDVTQADIDKITDPENWILQKKVPYADCIATPDGPAKAEIRIFYFWKEGWPRPVAVHNLSRMSKGTMIGTRYNKDKEWVGGTVAFFEQ